MKVLKVLSVILLLFLFLIMVPFLIIYFGVLSVIVLFVDLLEDVFYFLDKGGKCENSI